jgi:hemerythrin-like domain-containing protein
MDILSVIEKDHNEFRKQLQTMSETAESDHAGSTRLFRELHDHLIAHHEAEEHVLFRNLVKDGGAKDPVEEAWEEHTAIDLYLEEVKKSHKSERWQAKAAVLKELVEHHLDEEEHEVFDAARTALGSQLGTLGAKFEAEEQKQLNKG